MILEYIKKVVGIALTTPSNTLIQWCTINKTPEYQRKCDKNENCGSHTTLLWLGASFGAPFQLQAKPKACRFPLKHITIIPSFTKNTVHKSKAIILLLALISLLVTHPLVADTISDSNKYAYSENSGWLNFNSSHEGVSVYDDHLEGYVWAENIGWIRLGTLTTGAAHTYANNAANNYGVNNDGNGNLSGYGWSENAGWVNFNSSHSQVIIDAGSGDFNGYAWAENIGWVHFQNASPDYKVKRVLASNYFPDSGNPGGTIYFSVTGQALSAILTSIADGNKPAGMNSPFGKISYQVSAPVGGFTTVRLTFSSNLPAIFDVYKVDNSGNYTLMPKDSGADGFWHQVSSNTLEIRLKDGGVFDLDNLANGSIVDPIVVLAGAGVVNAIPTLSIWGLLFLTALLSLFAGRKLRDA